MSISENDSEKSKITDSNTLRYCRYVKVDVAKIFSRSQWKEEDWIKFVSVDRTGGGGYSLLIHVPEDMKTYKVCYKAIENDCYSLEFVPDEHRDRAICLKAVSKYGGALDCVPIKLRDKEMCWTAVNKSTYVFGYIPLEIRDYELCKKVVEKDGSAICDVPEIHKTTELCTIAMGTITKYSIIHIPEKVKTDDFFIGVMRNNGYSLHIWERIFPDFATEKVITDFAENNIENFYIAIMSQHMPMHFITPFITMKLIDVIVPRVVSDLHHLDYVPRNIVPKVLEKMGDKVPKEFNFNMVNKCLFSGEQFNKLLGKRKLYKFTNKEENHNGFQYQTKHNTLDEKKEKFNPTGECSAGGLYFTEEKYAYIWRNNNTYCRNVTIPNSALVYVEHQKFKTNEFILGERDELYT
jgi:hypothetical protein